MSTRPIAWRDLSCLAEGKCLWQRGNPKEMVKDTVLKHLGLSCSLLEMLSVLSAPLITTNIFFNYIFTASVIQADGPAKIYPAQARVRWKEVPILPPLMERNTPSMETATMCWPRYCVLQGSPLVNTTERAGMCIVGLFHLYRKREVEMLKAVLENSRWAVIARGGSWALTVMRQIADHVRCHYPGVSFMYTHCSGCTEKQTANIGRSQC